MNLPTLYKKTSTGAIQQWSIGVIDIEESKGPIQGKGGILVTRFGQVDGQIQETRDLITKGKNVGKKNETSPVQQAEAEATAKWEKQKKKGYVESVADAEAGKLDDLIEGGIVPMLAHKFSEQAHKIKYPAYAQPKLDGIRCIAILKDGKCTLWSRTRKPITGVPHIARFIEQNFGGEIAFDGELYNHEYKSNFEKIVSIVRQDEPADGHEIVQYHVYDLVTDQTFEERTQMLDSMLFHSTRTGGPLVEVQTCKVDSEEQVMEWFDKFRGQGYEGCMVRNATSKYVNKRSYDLQKVKEFDDAEFEIIGIDEGRGKLAGHVGAFVCKMADGKEFLAKMSGDTGKLRNYFQDHNLWKGKKLTVKYQGLTGKEGVPRFPVGISIRDYE